MDDKLKWQIKQLISKEVGEKLGIAERVEYEKIWKFIQNVIFCMNEPSKEFMEKNSVNRELGTVHIWAALEEWEKLKRGQIDKPCKHSHCHNGVVKIGTKVERCPNCEGDGVLNPLRKFQIG